jgi:hypothetical protein
MNRMISLCLLFAAGLCGTGLAQTKLVHNEGVPVLLEGAQPGQWTADLEGAKALAKDRNLPLLLAFTGSDWCIYCKLVFQTVFAKADWPEFASNRLVMVNIDLPREKNAIPETLKQRNESLAKSFAVEGFPTFVILAPDGTNVMGRFGASPNMDVVSFARECVAATRADPAVMAAFCKELPAEVATEYKYLVDELKRKESEFEAWVKTEPQRSEANDKKAADFREGIERATARIEKIETDRSLRGIAGADAATTGVLLERAARYSELAGEMGRAVADMNNWLLTRPDAGESASARLKALAGRIEQIETTIANLKTAPPPPPVEKMEAAPAPEAPPALSEVGGELSPELMGKLADLSQKLGAAVENARWAEAMALVENMRKQVPPQMEPGLDFVTFNIYLHKKDAAGAEAVARKLAEKGDDPQMLNALAWGIATAPGLPRRDLHLAEKIASKANEMAGSADAAILDTLARVAFMQGDAARAIRLQEKAVGDVDDPEMKKALDDTLQSYKAGKLPPVDDHEGAGGVGGPPPAP